MRIGYGQPDKHLGKRALRAIRPSSAEARGEVQRLDPAGSQPPSIPYRVTGWIYTCGWAEADVGLTLRPLLSLYSCATPASPPTARWGTTRLHNRDR